MSGSLAVSGAVVSEMVRLAALEVPGVLRVGHAGPRWRQLLAGRAVATRLHDSRVDVRLSIVARPGHPLGPLAADVRTAVGAAVVRLLGLELGALTVRVDGVAS